jgi:hypothetical protein
MGDPERGLEVARGDATPEEVAAVFGALAARGPARGGSVLDASDGGGTADGYAAWRRTRLAAVAKSVRRL